MPIAELEQLLRALLAQDLDALGLFQRLAPSIEAHLGTNAVSVLAEQIRGLRFAEAVATLREAQMPGPPAN